MPKARIARTHLAALAVILALPAIGHADDYAFTPALGSPFANNSDPGDVIVADIDGDTFPDAVLGDAFGNTISIFWGTSGGTFEATPLELTGPAWHLVVAKLDGDADLDIAGVANTLQPFFKDNGTRSFTAGPSQSLDTGDDFEPAAGLVAANFDQDADNDLAVTVFVAGSAGPSGAALRIFRNEPTGTFVFDHSELSDDDLFLGDIVVGQFNADADPDLAYNAQRDYYSTDSEPVIGVHLGGAGVEFTPGTDRADGGYNELVSGRPRRRRRARPRQRRQRERLLGQRRRDVHGADAGRLGVHGRALPR